MQYKTIDHTTLTHLAEAGVVRSAHVVGQPEKFVRAYGALTGKAWRSSPAPHP